MPNRTTFRSILRSHFGRMRTTTPAVIGGSILAKADCGLTTKQIIAKVPANARIIDVRVVGGPTGDTAPTTGTFQMDLEAVTTPISLLLVNVVAGSTSMTALGSKTVVAASYGLCFAADRDLSVTLTSGTAGQTVWFAVSLLPHDDGKLT